MPRSNVSRWLTRWFSTKRLRDQLFKQPRRPVSTFKNVKLRFEVLESRDVPSADPFPIFSTGVDANGSPLTAGTSESTPL